MYCSNIVGSACENAERIELPRALRYNYIGNPFEDSDYSQRIDNQVNDYCTKHQIKIAETKYEIFYICLMEEERYKYYIHLLYPIIKS